MRSLSHHRNPISRLVDSRLSSFLRIVCPSVLSGEQTMSVPRLPQAKAQSSCKLFAINMGFGGERHSHPVTTSCSMRMVVACQGEVTNRMSNLQLNVVLHDRYHSSKKGLSGVPEDRSPHGVFIATVETSCPYQGLVKVFLDETIHGIHVAAAPLECLEKEHAPGRSGIPNPVKPFSNQGSSHVARSPRKREFGLQGS